MIYLASTSARRQELLKQINVEYELLSIDIDETPQQDENPKQYVQRLALEKAQAGWNCSQRKKHIPVMGADTIVTIDGNILGKPKDEADAKSMLQQLSGDTHQAITAVALVQAQRHALTIAVTDVTFAVLSSAEIETYWKSCEPLGKAGSYGIQGCAAAFIQHLSGSYTGVVGLPLYETTQLLKEFCD